MLSYLVILAVLSRNGIVGKLCHMYEVTSRNNKLDKVSSKIFGLYKIDYRRICRGKPTYKHITQDSYIYTEDDKWTIGFSTSSTSCDFVPFTQNKVPRRGIWRYWAKNSLFTRDMEIKLQCTCGAVQVLGKTSVGTPRQTNLVGTYKPSAGIRCFDRTTYKHIDSDYYMHVNSENKWVISHGGRKNNTDLCASNGIAHNPRKYEDNVPVRRGWSITDENSNNLKVDTSLRAVCTCNAYLVSASDDTVIAGRNNMTGIYELYNVKRQCTGRQIYKHLEQDLFLYVDTDRNWIIGGTKELATCKNYAYAYSEIVPAGDTPSASRWKYHNYIKDSWCTDSEMTISCI